MTNSQSKEEKNEMPADTSAGAVEENADTSVLDAKVWEAVCDYVAETTRAGLPEEFVRHMVQSIANAMLDDLKKFIAEAKAGNPKNLVTRLAEDRLSRKVFFIINQQ